MQPKTSISRKNSRADHRLSRLRFLTVALVAFVGLSLTLAGCSTDDSADEGVDGNMAVVEEWIQAVNGQDAAQFEKLHTETALFHSHLQQSPSSGRENIWDAFSQSDAGPMQKIYMVGQGDFVCLQVTATDSDSSFLYVFRFEGDLIAQVHEYTAEHDLSEVPLFDGAEISTDDADLPDRIDIVDSQANALNERDVARFAGTFRDDAIRYGPLDKVPYRGAENIIKDVEAFLWNFPYVEMRPYQTFGRGNVVCQQVAVENTGVIVRSLGHLFVFEDGKVARSYQYVSKAELTK